MYMLHFISDPPLVLQSSSSTVNSSKHMYHQVCVCVCVTVYSMCIDNSSLSIGSESAATPTKGFVFSRVHKFSKSFVVDKLKRVSEHFCLGMRSLAAPVSGATPTSSNHSSIALDEFRSSLNTVLSEHINKINESLKNVLEEKEN